MFSYLLTSTGLMIIVIREEPHTRQSKQANRVR